MIASHSKYENLKSPAKKIASRLLKGCSGILKDSVGIVTETVQFMELFRIGRLDFVPRTDDIFLVTYPRSGTTWMQMILYQLASGGDMDFTHICQVAPWFERVISFNVMNAEDIEAMPSPRIFKSHLSYRWIPKGHCKYIYVARNGKDVAVSFFHFYKSHLGFKGDFPEFFNLFIRGKVQFGSWFEHVAGWRKHTDNPNILFLEYENLIRDLEGCLWRIIQFCGLNVSSDQFPEIMEKCSFAFMKKHESKFDHITATIWEKGYKHNTFLRNGKVGGAKSYMSEKQEKIFEQKLEQYIGKFGANFGTKTGSPHPSVFNRNPNP